jgi:hypothetical protein
VLLSARWLWQPAAPCECALVGLTLSSLPAHTALAVRIELGVSGRDRRHEHAEVSMESRMRGALLIPWAITMPWRLAAGFVRGMGVSAPLRPNFPNACVLPIPWGEAALSPLVQLSIPPDSKTAVLVLTTWLALPGGVFHPLSQW